VKFVLTPAAYDRLAADPAVTDPLQASDFLVSQYADSFFEYDSSGRVAVHSINGGDRTSRTATPRASSATA
jgi:hypothetical protein